MRIISLLFILTTLPKMLFGIGFGFYTPIGFGDKEVSDIYDDSNVYRRTIYYEPSIGFGVMVDTNVARDSLFGYRFNLEYSYRKVHSDSYQESKMPKSWRGNMTHTFTFGLYRSSAMRIWLGPRANVAYYRTVNSNGYRLTSMEIGFAAAFGANFHINDELSLTADIDYRMANAESERYNERNRDYEEYDAHIKGAVLRLGIMIRLLSDKFNEYKRVKRLIQRPL